MKLATYLPIFRISLQQEFVYRLNFIMWRLRNVMQIFLVFFLWDTIFSDPSRVVFGYDRSKILTYVFGISIVKSLVLASRSIDVSGEISRGDLANYLVKPMSYFKYWFVRDLSSKTLNFGFAFFEILILAVLLRPPIFIQTNIIYLLLFIVSIIFSIVLYYLILFIFNLFPLWYPDQAWGVIFLLFIFVDFLGGGVFPLDIVPAAFQRLLYLTPFPYLIYWPIQIYLSKVDILTSLKAISIEFIWILIAYFLLKYFWKMGLRAYSSEGR